MFDHYPEAAQLTHKSKRIVALNPACEAIGRHAGMIRAKHGPPEAHKGCLAMDAPKKHKAEVTIAEHDSPERRKYAVFWLPIEGYPDFYVHFSAGHPSYCPDSDA